MWYPTLATKTTTSQGWGTRRTLSASRRPYGTRRWIGDANPGLRYAPAWAIFAFSLRENLRDVELRCGRCCLSLNAGPSNSLRIAQDDGRDGTSDGGIACRVTRRNGSSAGRNNGAAVDSTRCCLGTLVSCLHLELEKKLLELASTMGVGQSYGSAR